MPLGPCTLDGCQRTSHAPAASAIRSAEATTTSRLLTRSLTFIARYLHYRCAACASCACRHTKGWLSHCYEAIYDGDSCINVQKACRKFGTLNFLAACGTELAIIKGTWGIRWSLKSA